MKPYQLKGELLGKQCRSGPQLFRKQTDQQSRATSIESWKEINLSTASLV
jgi:hypothetical protein